VALLPVVGLLSACGESNSRKRARADLVEQLVEGGLERPVADCVVEAFFDVRNDDELRAFFDREELTDDERREFAQLGEICVDAES
jgi:hypothetical protein